MAHQQKIKLFYERYYPFIITAIVVLLLFFFNDTEIVEKLYHAAHDTTFLTAIITAESIFFGFLLTTLSSLLQSKSKAIQLIIEHGRFPELVKYNKSAVCFSFLSVVFTSLFLLTRNFSYCFYGFFILIWATIVIDSFILCYRFLRLFYKLI